ncbi:uncharacterized protein [Centruroides vittatus]|uniref:uncharacterized protein n=1 Tax=Centruroides vittatus TaxID=120091 RepID=UPI00351026D3
MKFFILIALLPAIVACVKAHDNSTFKNLTKVYITAVPIYPHVLLDSKKNIVGGISFDLLKLIAEKLKYIKFETVQPVESKLGMKLKNGSWSGLIGRIQRKSVDIGLPYLFVTLDRLQSVDYLQEVLFDPLTFVVSSPKQVSKFSSVIKPFSFEAIWFLAITVLVSAYGGVLFSFLTYPLYEKVPTTIEELITAVKNGEYFCGTVKNSALEEFFLFHAEYVFIQNFNYTKHTTEEKEILVLYLMHIRIFQVVIFSILCLSFIKVEDNLQNMKETVIRLAVMRLPPHAEVNEKNEITNSISFNVLQIIIEKLRHIKIKTVQPIESIFGKKLENGTWNGLIGRIHRKEVDIGLPYAYITYNRSQAVEYLTPLIADNVIFIISSPKQASKLVTIFKPYSITDGKTRIIKVLGDYIKKHPENSFDSLDEAMRRVLSEKYAFLGPSVPIDFIRKQIGEDKFLISNDFLSTHYFGTPVRKRFEFKNKFNKMIRRMVDTGVFMKIKKDAWISSKVSLKDPTQPLLVEDMMSMFILLGIGYAIAIISLVLELFPPHTRINEKNEITNSIAFNMLQVIIQKLKNIKIKTIQPLESIWGTKSKNGTWSGLIGRVQRKEADIGLPYAYIIYERIQDVDFLIPLFAYNMIFVVSSPKEASKLTTIIQPFAPNHFAIKLLSNFHLEQELVRNSSKIKITTMAISPYCELNTRNNELIVDGPDFKILSIVAQKLKNIKFEFVQPIEKTFGSKLKDGSWNGIIGRVQRKEVDLSTLSLCVTYDRFQVVDFTIPVTGDKVVFIVSSPRKLSKLTAIIRPFSLKTWIYIVVSTFVTAISFSFIAFVRNNYFPERKTAWTTRNFTWFLLRSLTSQGGEIDYDKSTSSRVIIGVWLLATTVLISAYGGILFSYMTRPVYEEVPKNIEQLAIAVKNKEYSCGTLSNSALSELMLGKSEGTVKILSEYISSHPEESFSTFQQGIQHMLHHKYAYITSAYFFATLNMRENSFVISEDLFMSYSIAFPTKKKFKFKNKFNKMLRRLVDAGIYEKLLREAKQAPGVGYTDIHHPLSIDDGMSAFILLGSGYILSYIPLVNFYFDNVKHMISVGSHNLSVVSLSGVQDAMSKHVGEDSEFKGVKVHFHLDENGILKIDHAESIFEKKLEDETSDETTVESTLSKLGNTIGKLFSTDSSKADNKEEASDESQSANNETSDDSNINKNVSESTKNETQDKVDKKGPKIITIKENVVVNYLLGDFHDMEEAETIESLAKLKKIDDQEREKLAQEKAKNALESFILETKNKLYTEEYEKAATKEEIEKILSKLSEEGDWLEYESEEAKTEVFKEKLSELKSLTKELFKRVQEHKDRPDAINALNDMINISTIFLKNAQKVPKEEQIFTDVEITTLEKLISETEQWKNNSVKEQENTPLYENPKLTIKSIAEKIAALDREVKYLLNKARFAVPKTKQTEEGNKETSKNNTQTNETESTEETQSDIDSEKEIEPNEKENIPENLQTEENVADITGTNEEPTKSSDESKKSNDHSEL